MFVQFDRREFLNFRDSHKRMVAGELHHMFVQFERENSSTLETATRG
jgi:hypothetical protein